MTERHHDFDTFLVSRPFLPTPDNACDAHAHVFGPFQQFPLAADRAYDSPELPAAAYLHTLDTIGFTRGVVVTPSAYGLQNGAMLNALRAAPGRLRGIAVADHTTSFDQLLAMNAQGVRGLRFSEMPGYPGTVGLDEFEKLAPAMRELNWHAQIWTSLGNYIRLAARMRSHRLQVVLDHMALPKVDAGLEDAEFQMLIADLKAGNVWIKLTAYRLQGQQAGCDHIRSLHDALVATNPDRLVWGTDWPHVNLEVRPNTGVLVDLFNDWVTDATIRKKILVDNPALLYGF